jgi:hypothetical protein
MTPWDDIRHSMLERPLAAIMCRSKLCAVQTPIPGRSRAQVGSYFT